MKANQTMKGVLDNLESVVISDGANYRNNVLFLESAESLSKIVVNSVLRTVYDPAGKKGTSNNSGCNEKIRRLYNERNKSIDDGDRLSDYTALIDTAYMQILIECNAVCNDGDRLANGWTEKVYTTTEHKKKTFSLSAKVDESDLLTTVDASPIQRIYRAVRAEISANKNDFGFDNNTISIDDYIIDDDGDRLSFYRTIPNSLIDYIEIDDDGGICNGESLKAFFYKLKDIPFTATERRLLSLFMKGYTTTATAERLSVTTATVSRHRLNISTKILKYLKDNDGDTFNELIKHLK